MKQKIAGTAQTREEMFILQRSVQCLSAIVTPVVVKVFKESMNV
jgi:hypothetical protein